MGRLIQPAKILWAYEPDCFGDESDHYLPDYGLGKSWRNFAEITPEPSSHEREQIRQRMDFVRSPVPDASLFLLCRNDDGGVTINYSLSVEKDCLRWTIDREGAADERQDDADDDKRRWAESLQRVRDRAAGQTDP